MHAASPAAQRSCGVWKRSKSSSTSAPHKHATTIGGGSALPHPQINAPIAPCARLNSSPTNPRRAGVTAVAALPVQAMAAAAAALGAAALGAAALAWRSAAKAAGRPELIYDKDGASDGGFMAAVLAHCPTLQSEYRPLPFLSNGHVETIALAKLRRGAGVEYAREVLLTDDGGAVAVDWEVSPELPETAPLLVLLPGLTGGSGDTYVEHAVVAARSAGIRAAVFNSRGTADSPVLTPQFYSASFTGDTRAVIAHVRKRFPHAARVYAAGWSLGANILVNYLAEEGERAPLDAAVSMCNPFDLTISNRHLESGFNRIYDANLAASLRRIFARHTELWRTAPPPLRPDLVPSCRTIREFDEAITIHSFGWPDVDAYYAGSSSAAKIDRVSVPLLCVQAANDPIAPAEAIPYAALRANPRAALAVTPAGGHLGWAAGRGAPFGAPWTDDAVMEWLAGVTAELAKRGAPKAGGGEVVAKGGNVSSSSLSSSVPGSSSAGNNGSSKASSSAAALVSAAAAASPQQQ